VTPHKNCRLKLLKLERIKDFLLMEDEFIQNQERLKPQEEKNEVMKHPIKMLTSSEVTSLELTPDIGIDIEHP
jgi:26S proteasome regulatory subunit T2